MCLCTRSWEKLQCRANVAGQRQCHAQSRGGGESKGRWAQSVAVGDCLQSVLKPWTWTGPNHHNPCAVFRAGNMGEEKQRRLCLVSSEKCWLIPWQFLGRFCTLFQPDTQLSKVLNVNSAVLYPFTSPYSHWLGMWTTRPPYFDAKVVSFLVTMPSFPFPSFSLFLVRCSNLKFSGWLLSFSRDLRIPDQVRCCDTEQLGTLSCELSCLSKSPAKGILIFKFQETINFGFAPCGVICSTLESEVRLGFPC